jgi:hypothetical protein
VWSDNVIWWLAAIALTLTIVSIFSAVILLDARENAYCVPMERASSLVAGVAGSLLLALGWGLPWPGTPDLIGALILIGPSSCFPWRPGWAHARPQGPKPHDLIPPFP